MSTLQIQASALAVLTEKQRIQRGHLGTTELMVRATRRSLLEAMEATGATSVIGGDFLFERREVVVFDQHACLAVTPGSGERWSALVSRRLTDAERSAQADAAADRLDELRDLEADMAAHDAYAAAEGPQYDAAFELARF